MQLFSLTYNINYKSEMRETRLNIRLATILQKTQKNDFTLDFCVVETCKILLITPPLRKITSAGTDFTSASADIVSAQCFYDTAMSLLRDGGLDVQTRRCLMLETAVSRNRDGDDIFIELKL
jgi:hypothetical protein